jgi:hypothetical protein
MPPPEDLDAQVPDKQCEAGAQFLASLLPAKRGWFANHALPLGRSA